MKRKLSILFILLAAVTHVMAAPVTGTSTEAQENTTFTMGYTYTFETVGTTVNITFELLDERNGVVAYLWNRTNEFYEMGMHVTGKTATISLTDQSVGETLKFACKFAFENGMAVTKDFTYIVGDSGEEDVEIYSWCYATNEQLTREQGSAYLTWTTAENGDVVITIDNATFRNGGFENKDGSWDASWNVLSGEGLATIESASVYFNAGTLSADNTTYTITKKADATLSDGAVLQFAGHAFSWTIGDAGPYFTNPDMRYTYGLECVYLDAPTNVAVTDAGVITFDEVANAEKYVANIYQGTTLVDSEEVTNDATLSYQSYVAGTFTVKVIATAKGQSDSPESEGASWNLQASPLPASKFCLTEADVITTNNGYCSPIFTIQTQENGNVTIVISAGEGNEGETKFRNSGMNGTFKLNGSEADFAAYFDKGKTDDYTYTLTLKDAANKPALGAVISYAGMIEARSSIHGDDWSNYQLDGYLYGTTCSTDAAVTGVTLNQSEATLPYNRTLTLQASITPGNAANKEVTWASSHPEVATVADGVVTPVAQEGTTTITVTTKDGGYTATCVVTLAAAKYAEPNTAAPRPTVDANLVKSIYSDAYTSSGYTFGNWGGTHAEKKLDIDGDKSRVYTSNTGNYFGIQFAAINAISMKYLHLDVWAENDQEITIVPIYRVVNAAGALVNGTEYGKSVVLKGQQWNAINFELAKDFAQVTTWANVYQIKFDALQGLTIALDNIYFYTDPDEVAPELKLVTATVGYESVELLLDATDDSGVVAKCQVVDAVKGVNQTLDIVDNKVTLQGLKQNTEYNLSVIVFDAVGNYSESKSVSCKTLYLGENIALGKMVVAGTEAMAASNAVDGKISLDAGGQSRWASGGSAKHVGQEGVTEETAEDWLYVDLGALYQISDIRFLFEGACPKDFDLLTSTDAVTWTKILHVSGDANHPLIGTTSKDYNHYQFTDLEAARYVKIFARAADYNFAYGISIWEFEVYGKKISSMAPKPNTVYLIIQKEWNDWKGNTKTHYWGGSNGTTWPGVAMTNENITTELGDEIYSVVLPEGTTGINFNIDGKQTRDLTIDWTKPYFYLYYDDVASGEDNKKHNCKTYATIEDVYRTIYYVNSTDWASVNAYVWYNDGQHDHNRGGWPGEKMNLVDGIKDQWGKDVYTLTVPSLYTNVIFSNDGAGQTSEFIIADCDEKYYREGEWHESLDIAYIVNFVNAWDWENVSMYLWNSKDEKDYPQTAWPGSHIKQSLPYHSGDGKQVYQHAWLKKHGALDWIIFNDGRDNDKNTVTKQTTNQSFVDRTEYFFLPKEWKEGKVDGYWRTNKGVYLVGSWDWATEFSMVTTETPTDYAIYVDVILEAERAYEFKLHTAHDEWWSMSPDNYTFTRTNTTTTMWEDNGNSKVEADIKGKYRFVYDPTTNKLTIQYPEKPNITSVTDISNTRNELKFKVQGNTTTYVVNGIEYTLDESGYLKVDISSYVLGSTGSVDVFAKDDYDNISKTSIPVPFAIDGCTFDAGAGSGRSKDALFEVGYTIAVLQLSETEMEVNVLYKDVLTGVAPNAYILWYDENNNERQGTTIANDRTGLFKGTVPIPDIVRDKELMALCVKFEIPNKVKLTDYFYYNTSTMTCVDEQVFEIYHYDDAPDGGRIEESRAMIPQPIQYKRKFRPGMWETLCVPFEVERVTVIDEDGEWPISAQYNVGTTEAPDIKAADYWLRTFDVQGENVAVTAENFQSNWQDIRAASAAEALPKKNVPYIMMLPSFAGTAYEGYYDNKYIVFHGRAYQHIATEYVQPAAPDDECFAYSGNNTMMPQGLEHAYVLDAAGEYFDGAATVTLQPFECAVNATAKTVQRMPRLGLNRQVDVTTDTPRPTTADVSGEVYSLMGIYMGQYTNIDEQMALLQRLPQGLYVVRTNTEVTKIWVEE